MKGNTASGFLDKSLYFVYLIFLASIVCAVRPLSSIALGCMLVLAVIKNKLETGRYTNKKANNVFLWGCIAFYLLQVIALIYTNDFASGLRHLQLKSSLVIIPLALCLSNYPDRETRNRMLKHYVLILLAAMLFCLVVALKRFFADHASESVFFYHPLVSPFSQHAIQFSILVFIGFVYLLVTAGRREFMVNYFCHLMFIVFFLFFLLLLSSKLVIVFAAVSLVCYLVVMVKKHAANRVITGIVVFSCILLTSLVLLTRNHISARFNEIVSEDLSMVKKDSFNQGTSFNGLQFRLLQWRVVSQILNENKGWVKGVSPGDAQAFIDKKYVEKNMYTGNGGDKRGFLGYDAHNQFLESILQTGIAGLLAFVIICIGAIQLAVRTRDLLQWATTLILLAYTLNESVFETQYGLMLFVFFPLFLYSPRKPAATQPAVN